MRIFVLPITSSRGGHSYGFQKVREVRNSDFGSPPVPRIPPTRPPNRAGGGVEGVDIGPHTPRGPHTRVYLPARKTKSGRAFTFSISAACWR